MNWDAIATARQLIASDQHDQAVRLLRDLRLHHGHPAAGTLLAAALQAQGQTAVADAILSEDCELGLADHWSWLARADLAVASGQEHQAAQHRAQAYALLGWPDCVKRGYRFRHDQCSQQLPRWNRCLTLLLQPGPLQVLSVGGGEGAFVLWALERLAPRGGRITTLGPMAEDFARNLERCDPDVRAGFDQHLQQLDACGPADGEGRWDWIQLGPACTPADGWQQRLRPWLKPHGVMLADDPACLSGAELLLPGVLLAGWRAGDVADQAPSS